MARQLLLIRHGPVAPAYAGRYLGSTDVALADMPPERLAGLIALLRSRCPQRCFCSPLLRARQTAGALCPSLNLAIQTDADLREVDFGHWENKRFEEIAGQWPQEVSRWAEFSGDFAFPGGESISGFLDRTRRAAERLVGDQAQVVVVVTHGGVIRAMICHLLGLTPRQYVLFNVRCATCTTIDLFDGKGVLSGLSETAVAEGW